MPTITKPRSGLRRLDVVPFEGSGVTQRIQKKGRRVMRRPNVDTCDLLLVDVDFAFDFPVVGFDFCFGFYPVVILLEPGIA